MAREVDATESSPDGWLRVDYYVSPGRMSHEIRSPTLVDARSGRTLFSMDTNWDADAVWGGPGVVTFDLRYYPEGGFTSIGVTVDAGKGQARIDDGEPRPLKGLPEALEQVFEEKARRKRAGAGGPVPVRFIHVVRFVAIAVGSIALIAGGAYAWKLYGAGEPAAKQERPLASVPKPTRTAPAKDYR